MKAEKKVEKKATPVKATAKAAVNAVTKEESTKAVKEEKVVEAKPTVKAETTAKAVDDVKATKKVDAAIELKAEPDHVGEVKKPARKKPVAKATAKAATKAAEKAVEAVQETTFIEFSDCQVNIQDIIDSAKAHYKALYEKENGSLKTIALYVKPEERVAYYVANGVGSDDYKVGM